jgi:hypothetical protein
VQTWLICRNIHIRLYGRRWDIEVFFKTCKSVLKLSSEYHGLSYDALTSHVSIVFARYIFLAYLNRMETDERSFGDLYKFQSKSWI